MAALAADLRRHLDGLPIDFGQHLRPLAEHGAQPLERLRALAAQPRIGGSCGAEGVELAKGLEVVERLVARGVLAEGLGEAGEADELRRWIEECDRVIAGTPATLASDGTPKSS